MGSPPNPLSDPTIQADIVTWREWAVQAWATHPPIANLLSHWLNWAVTIGMAWFVSQNHQQVQILAPKTEEIKQEIQEIKENPPAIQPIRQSESLPEAAVPVMPRQAVADPMPEPLDGGVLAQATPTPRVRQTQSIQTEQAAEQQAAIFGDRPKCTAFIRSDGSCPPCNKFKSWLAGDGKKNAVQYTVREAAKGAHVSYFVVSGKRGTETIRGFDVVATPREVFETCQKLGW